MNKKLFKKSFITVAVILTFSANIIFISLPVLAAENDIIAPAKPSQFISIRKTGSITLAWINPADLDFNKVIIVRSNGRISDAISGNDLRNYGAIIYNGDLNTYEDKNIENDTVYHYAISAYDNAGNYSQPIILTVPRESGMDINNPAVKVLGVETDYRVLQLNKIINEAGIIFSGNINSLLGNAGKIYNNKSEADSYIKYTTPLIKGQNLQQDSINAITNFIVYGAETTQILGEGERAGVISSYKSAFGKLPSTQSEWEDVVKIANGRWPAEKNNIKEDQAKIEFKRVYKRDANMNSANDNAAVTIIAYGLRPDNRNTYSEATAIESFKSIYGHNPVSALAWDIVRAIAYSGAKR